MRCPHCGEESFARKKNLTENWKIIGQVEVCALCGKELPRSSAGEKDSSVSGGGSAAKSRLASLLGGDFTEKVTLGGTADRNFCRNCRHFLVHPFKSVCALTDLEADPMGECGSFAERPAENPQNDQ